MIFGHIDDLDDLKSKLVICKYLYKDVKLVMQKKGDYLLKSGVAYFTEKLKDLNLYSKGFLDFMRTELGLSANDYIYDRNPATHAEKLLPKCSQRYGSLEMWLALKKRINPDEKRFLNEEREFFKTNMKERRDEVSEKDDLLKENTLTYRYSKMHEKPRFSNYHERLAVSCFCSPTALIADVQSYVTGKNLNVYENKRQTYPKEGAKVICEILTEKAGGKAPDNYELRNLCKIRCILSSIPHINFKRGTLKVEYYCFVLFFFFKICHRFSIENIPLILNHSQEHAFSFPREWISTVMKRLVVLTRVILHNVCVSFLTSKT